MFAKAKSRLKKAFNRNSLSIFFWVEVMLGLQIMNAMDPTIRLMETFETRGREWMERQEETISIPGNEEKYQAWLSGFDHLRSASLLKKLDVVQACINDSITYTSDSAQYSMKEYWASPLQTMLSLRGDCEDYAILKLCVLKYLGVPESRLNIVLVSSEPNGDKIDHAILVVDVSSANDKTELLALNNSSEGPMPFKDVPYQPILMLSASNPPKAQRFGGFAPGDTASVPVISCNTAKGAFSHAQKGL